MLANGRPEVARDGGWLGRPARRRSLLALVVLVGMGLRLHGVNFGLPGLYDPDELMFELGAVRMLRTATLNPGWFGHPATVTMYALALVDIGVFLFGHAMGWFHSVVDFARAIWIDPGWVILPHRVLMVLFAAGNIVVAERIARRLWGPAAGLAAAALIACDPVHVTWSQVVRSDVMACLFMLLCMDAAISWLRAGSWRALARGALWLALAVACKWPFGLSALAFAGAATWRWRQGLERGPAALGRTAAFVALAAVLLLVIAPYLLIENATVVRDLGGEAQSRHLGATGGTPWWNLRWYLERPVRDGFGPVGLGLMLTGIADAIRRRRHGAAVVLPLLFGFLAVLCFQTLVWERWTMPLLVIGAILGGGGAAAILRTVPGGRQPVRSAGVAAVTLLTLAPLADAAVARSRARMNDTRAAASRWAVGHIPAGSTVMIEHFAFDLYPQPWRLLFPLGDAGCIDAKALLHGKTSYAPISAGRRGRSNVDYGTMAVAMRPSCRADFAILSQYDRYAAERDRFPAEYAAYRQLIAQGTIVASFVPVPGENAGPAIRVVRFGKASR